VRLVYRDAFKIELPAWDTVLVADRCAVRRAMATEAAS
jgi:hypothetical protein